MHAAVYLYSSYPEKLGPHNAKLFILHNAPVEVRDLADPLELSGVPNPAGNMLAGARFYADPHHSPAAEAARRLHRRHPREAGLIQQIADQPFTDRFGSWNGRTPKNSVFQFLRNADVQDPTSIPTLATYWIVNGQCARGGGADPPSRIAAYEYGQRLARALHGAHFVVSTSDNGRGPLRPHDRVHHGNEILCGPKGRGLGPKPTSDTGYAFADAFAWIALPGKSGGSCGPGVKAPPIGAFWPANAVGLVLNANYAITGPRRGHLERAR